MSEQPGRASVAVDSAIRPLGLSHYAFTTWDLSATVHFYTEILGMRLLRTELIAPAPPYNQYDGIHVFFDMGGGNLMAFMAFDGLPPQPAPDLPPRDDLPFGAFHMAFQVADEAALLAAKARLKAQGIRVIGPLDHEWLRSIYFDDPNGLHLELAAPVRPLNERDAEQAQHLLDGWLVRQGRAAEAAP